MTLSIEQLHIRHLGPYTIPAWLDSIIGDRERKILNHRNTCHYPHKLNRDTDFYGNDNCITYHCEELGNFTIDTKTQLIIG